LEKQADATAAPRPDSARPDVYGDLFRRILLGATAALLTARMLAPGEDPGILQVTSGPANMLLPLGWILAAVGLAVWRLGSRRGDWRGGAVETALLVAAVLVFVGAEGAGYRHPARIMAWDWLSVFLVVCLIRQLAVSPADQQAVFAVFLAGAASLAAQALYQAVEALCNPTTPHGPPSATFAQPGPFAAWMALFLPGLLMAQFICRFGRAPRWQTAMTAIFAVLGGVALIVAVVSTLRNSDPATPPLPDVWQATGRMIYSRPVFGFGAGNFSRAFPSFEAPGPGGVVTDPHNFALEIAATCGLPALLAVMTALGAFLAWSVRWLFRKGPDAVDPPVETEVSRRTRWEFYIGGMCGLVFGFVIRQSTGDHVPDEILMEGFLACGRCLVWLTAFALFERVAWSGRARVGALTVGVVAMLIVLSVTSGIGLPSLTVPLWAAIALGLNGLPQPEYARINRLALTRILPAAAMATIAMLYFLDVFLPVTSCSAVIQTVRANGREYARILQANDSQLFARFSLEKEVLKPLRDAAKDDDPDDARPQMLLALWEHELWYRTNAPKIAEAARLAAREVQRIDPHGRDGYVLEYDFCMEFGRRREAPAESAGAAIGPTYRIFLQEARWPNPGGLQAIDKAKKEARADEPAVQYMEAAAVLEKYLANAPNDIERRFQLAETFFKAWEDERCRDQAAAALRLDKAAGRSPLTEEQRRKLNAWNDLSH
jgi:hypothetical protein